MHSVSVYAMLDPSLTQAGGMLCRVGFVSSTSCIVPDSTWDACAGGGVHEHLAAGPLFFRQLSVSCPCAAATLVDVRALPQWPHTFGLRDDWGVSRSHVRDQKNHRKRAAVNFSQGELFPVTVVLDCSDTPERKLVPLTARFFQILYHTCSGTGAGLMLPSIHLTAMHLCLALPPLFSG